MISRTVVLALAALWCVLSAARPAYSAEEGVPSRFSQYRIPKLCPANIARDAQCPRALPLCCEAAFAIRCCPEGVACGHCTSLPVRGYDMARGNYIISGMSLCLLALLGSVIAAGVGKHAAWCVERSRVVAAYKKRAALRRAQVVQFREELRTTEDATLRDEEACVICCARRIDCALAPCGHLCNCHFCAARLTECPVCRQTVQRCFQLPPYLVAALVRGGSAVVEGALAAPSSDRSGESSGSSVTDAESECRVEFDGVDGGSGCHAPAPVLPYPGESQASPREEVEAEGEDATAPPPGGGFGSNVMSIIKGSRTLYMRLSGDELS